MIPPSHYTRTAWPNSALSGGCPGQQTASDRGEPAVPSLPAGTGCCTEPAAGAGTTVGSGVAAAGGEDAERGVSVCASRDQPPSLIAYCVSHLFTAAVDSRSIAVEDGSPKLS